MDRCWYRSGRWRREGLPAARSRGAVDARIWVGIGGERGGGIGEREDSEDRSVECGRSRREGSFGKPGISIT